jgi:hypothetical protein
VSLPAVAANSAEHAPRQAGTVPVGYFVRDDAGDWREVVNKVNRTDNRTVFWLRGADKPIGVVSTSLIDWSRTKPKAEPDAAG